MIIQNDKDNRSATKKKDTTITTPGNTNEANSGATLSADKSAIWAQRTETTTRKIYF